MAAVPEYPSGATEHWGLITYRETALMFDNKTSSADNQERVANVIAHELAHQWFGNLITVAWWNEYYKGLKSYESDWDTDSKFLTDTLHESFTTRRRLGSRFFFTAKLDNPDQITAVFDTISYNKGASVIRMMEGFMGAEDFRQGITNFLQKYSYKTVVTQDLFDELTAASSLGLDITKIMKTWDHAKGYPVISVTKNEEGLYTLKQERFLQNPDSAVGDIPSQFNYKWETHQSWLHVNDPQLEIKGVTGEWLKFNVDQRGYYRVNYALRTGRLFRISLDLSRQHVQLGQDRGLPLHEDTLELSGFLKKERALAPWTCAMDEFIFLNSIFRSVEDIRTGLFTFQRDLLSDLYADLGWNDESGTTTSSSSASVPLPYPAASWKDSGKEPVPNFKALVCRYGLPEDSQSWTWLLDLFKSEKNAQRRDILLLGLCSSKSPEILKNFLEISKDEEIVRRQDYFTALSYMSRNPWEYLVDRFSLNDRIFGRFLSTATSQFSTEERLQEIKDFFSKYPEAGAGENYRKIALENVKNNIQFIANTLSPFGLGSRKIL
ncbi:Aminopeptidase, partial [Caligus rogercresseyi]